MIAQSLSLSQAVHEGMSLGDYINEELTMTNWKEFTIAGQHITIDNAVATSWLIMGVLTVLAFLLTRNLKVTGPISKRQAFLELAYTKSVAFFEETLGPNGKQFTEYLMSTALFIGFSNLIGMFGLKPPTRSMLVTGTLAVFSIIIVEYTEFKTHGFIGRLKGFTKPMWVITPLNIIEVFTKPLSLCMRLFGNILGAFIIMEMINYVTYKMLVPMVFSLYFDIFDGLLQAYIFCFLTAIYISQAGTHEEEEPKKAKKRMKEKHDEMLKEDAA